MQDTDYNGYVDDDEFLRNVFPDEPLGSSNDGCETDRSRSTKVGRRRSLYVYCVYIIIYSTYSYIHMYIYIYMYIYTSGLNFQTGVLKNEGV